MANEMRDRLVELLLNGEKQFFDTKANRTTPLQSYLSNYLIENGVVVPQWISVNDRLPETNGKYLVAYYSMQFKKYFLDLLYYDVQNKDEYFYCAENYKQKVDYWMPLPEPPKKEGVDNEKL